MEAILLASRPVRGLLACVAALVAVNAAVIGARLTDGSATDAPDVVIVDEVPDDTVMIVAPDGSTISVDPSTAAGKKAIVDAEARGDTIVTTPSDDPHAAGGLDDAAARQSTDELDAADGVVDGLVRVVDEQTGAVVQVPTANVDVDGDGNVDLPDVPDVPGDDDPPSDDEPLVSVTIPGVTITTPAVSVTTPPVSVTTPPVEVSTPVATVTVPTTTVTVPQVTITVPTTTVTVAPITVTVPSETVPTVDLGL